MIGTADPGALTVVTLLGSALTAGAVHAARVARRPDVRRRATLEALARTHARVTHTQET